MAHISTYAIQRQTQASAQPTNPNNPFRRTQPGQPPPFRATGHGWFNKLPRYDATEGNANASLINQALLNTGSRFYKKYLFVNAVETGWELSGEATQSQTSRAFYPRNLQQDELLIEGIVASQYDYDLLVEWVQFHHHYLFSGAVMNANVGNDGSGIYTFPGIVFQLHQPQNAKMKSHPYMRYLVVIESIESGHQKGQMAGLPFQMTCKVVYDYLGAQVDVEAEIQKLVTIKSVLGNVQNPAPSPGWSELETSIIQAGQIAAEQSDLATGNTSGSAIKQIANDR